MLRTYGYVYILVKGKNDLLGAFSSRECAFKYASEQMEVTEAYFYQHGDDYREWGLADTNGNLQFTIVQQKLMAYNGDCY